MSSFSLSAPSSEVGNPTWRPMKKKSRAAEQLLRDVLDVSRRSRAVATCAGDGAQPLEECVDRRSGASVLAQLREAQGQQFERGDLGDEGLGRGDRDLEARAGVDHGVGLSRERGVDDVRDADDAGASTLGLADGLDGVDRLATLGDPDHERADLDDRVAVAVLTRDVDLDAQAGPPLDRVLGDLGRVVRRAGGHDDDALELAQFLVIDAQLVEGDRAVTCGDDRAASARIASGCSLISLVMKSSWPPFSAVSRSQSIESW